MEKVIFQMNPTKSDFSKATWAKIKISPIFRSYFWFTGIVFCCSFILVNITPATWEEFLTSFTWYALFAFMLPLAALKGYADRSFRKCNIKTEEFEFDEQGLSMKT